MKTTQILGLLLTAVIVTPTLAAAQQPNVVVASDGVIVKLQNGLYGELFPEGTVDGNICLTVIEGDTGSLVLILEETFSFDETRLFFALP